MRTIRAARVFDGTRTFAPGVLTIQGPRVVGVGPDDGWPSDVDLGDVTLAPGFVDVHGHGGGGASFPDDPAAVLATHRAHGTTTSIASLVTQHPDVLTAQVAALTSLVDEGELAGLHLEGPWLGTGHRGAHPAKLLRSPATDEVRRVVDAGAVRMVTLAPELEGALDAIALLAGRGIVAAVGHTDAGYEDCRQAIAAGATGATHLFNGMPPLAHRAPGPVLALVEDERVWLELVADGHHVDLALVRHVFAQHPGRVVLVTDAMAAAGCGDGDYPLGDAAVEVRDGVARIAGTDTLAGSTLTLDVAVRNVVRAGVPLEDALRAATRNPARYLDLGGVGEFRPDAWADAVALADDLEVVGVLRRGVWITGPAPAR